jgi:hypothetical protein
LLHDHREGLPRESSRSGSGADCDRRDETLKAVLDECVTRIERLVTMIDADAA